MVSRVCMDSLFGLFGSGRVLITCNISVAITTLYRNSKNFGQTMPLESFLELDNEEFV